MQQAFDVNKVSTHSRPKAAGLNCENPDAKADVSTHSRPKAAGPGNPRAKGQVEVSTHSRPKAAGNFMMRFL